MCLNHNILHIIKQILTYGVGQYGFYGSSATILTSALLGQYCCLRSIKLHITLFTGPYLYNISMCLKAIKVHTIKCDHRLTTIKDETEMEITACMHQSVVTPSLYSTFKKFKWTTEGNEISLPPDEHSTSKSMCAMYYPLKCCHHYPYHEYMNWL